MTTAKNAGPRRVLIAQKFATLGGGQVSLVHHLASLDRSRFAPLVVVSDQGWLTTRLDELKIPWLLLKFTSWTKPKSWLLNPVLVWKLSRIIRQNRIELIHANEHWVGPPVYHAARRARIPSICHFRTGLEDLTPRRIRKYLYSRFDRVIVVAEVLRKAMSASVQDPSKIRVVRDGVEVPSSPPRPHKRRSRCIVLNVGALYEVKGQAKILDRSLPWLKKNRHRYLVFVGGTRTSPSYVESMRQVVRDNGLTRQVLFLGSREDVPRLLNLADVLVAYSTVEGIPRVVMEAMFAARPVIVSNTAGMDEVVVDGEVGRIVDFEDLKNELARTLEDVAASGPRWIAMGQNAYARATSRYSVPAMSEAIQDIYTELLEQPADARTAA